MTVPLVADVSAALAPATDVVTRNERVLKDLRVPLGTGPADIRVVNGAAMAVGR